MTYIPKNKFKPNQYTSGTTTPGMILLATKSNELYIGYYHLLYNGKIFSGENPNSPNKQELFRVNTDGTRFLNLSSPTPYNPLLPTPQDYKNGVFTRYFSIRRNQPLFTEINNNTYKLFQQQDSQVPWKLYRVFSLSWELTGNINKVAQTNKNITEIVEQREKAVGLGLYLKENWTQYYKEKA